MGISQPIELLPLAPVLSDYDIFAVAFSGGKDSMASLFDLLDKAVPRHKIILLHHDVDGEDSTLMDWPCTKAYCQAVADHLGIRILFSWKVGGFEGEMTRNDSITKPVKFELSTGGTKQVGGVKGKKNTRMMFPQTAADLRTRWCSAYLKVDVGGKVLVHDPLFSSGKVLFITGERAEESKSRSKYQTFLPHFTDLRNGKKKQRHIDHWRNVHGWSEQAVWDLIAKFKILPHPAYFLGWGRTSCLACIFGSANQWATIQKFMPEHFKAIADYETEFGVTIHRKLSVIENAAKGTPYDCDPHWLAIAMSREFNISLRVDNWTLPAGAFGESNGPT